MRADIAICLCCWRRCEIRADAEDFYSCDNCINKERAKLIENFRNNDCYYSAHDSSNKRRKEYYQENKARIAERNKKYRQNQLNQSEAAYA